MAPKVATLKKPVSKALAKSEVAAAISAAAHGRNELSAVTKLDPATHRRILNFLNAATRPEDLVYEKITPVEGDLDHEDNPEAHHVKRKTILDLESARKIIAYRDLEYPLGFRHLRELIEIRLDRRVIDLLLHHFSAALYGSWSVFPQNIPRRGPGGYDGVVHAP